MAYKAQNFKYPLNMNQCFSCDHTIYPPLSFAVHGDFINYHGHRIWVEKYGAGIPAVILINGGGETTRQWNNNIQNIAKYTTVIAYDRAGLGLSDTVNHKVRTAKDIVSRFKYILAKTMLNLHMSW